MSHEPLLDRLIGEFLLAEERAAPLDREAMLRAHPELAEQLREFFASHDALKPPAAPLREPDLSASAAGDLPTQAFRSEGPFDSSLETSVDGGAGLPSFGDYQLERELGRGGMGVVYRARRRSLGKTVALKTLLPGALHDPSAVRRFYVEAEAAARLDHPGIVPVFDVGEHQGRHFYSMALVEGSTLSERIAAGPLPPVEAAELLRQVALAVAHAHQHDVVHRDLKPANILIDQANRPRITDFGLAKTSEDALELTRTGQIIGTLAYMAPEQAAARSGQIGPAADIYALGAVLYAALTGAAPFQGESQAELLVKVLTAEPAMPLSPHGRCHELAKICLRCLEKDPEHRYATAQELADDLDRYLQGEPVQAGDTPWPHRVKKWVRRQPSLAAHLLAIGSIELLRHSKHWWQQGTWLQDLRISSLLLLWAALCIVMQWLLRRVGETARYLWAAVDLVLLTWVLALTDNPHGPLLATYAVAIVFSGLLFRARLVVVTTLGATAGYLWLLLLHPSSDPPHYHLLFVAMLLLIGTTVGFHLRRLRLLDQVYRRRIGPLDE